MNLSFSTRGWESLSWDETVRTAKECGFDGIEVYDPFTRGDLAGALQPLGVRSLSKTCRRLFDINLRIPCIDSPLDLSCEQDRESIKGLMEMAHALRCPNVGVKSTTDDPDISSLLELARELDVSILISTRRAFESSAKLRAYLDRHADDRLAALWDIHHTFRAGESAADTIRELGAYVRHVHVKDSSADGCYRLVGEGALPIASFMRSLESIDYGGFISMEWKSEWGEGAEAESAVAFPYFSDYMRRFERSDSGKDALFANSARTGKYIWRKDELISLTFPQVLDRVASEFPDQLAFKYTTLDYTRTYAEFKRDADDFAAALISLGVRKGSKVAIWATNVPAWFVTFWATVRIGAVLVTVNTAYKIHEAEYLLRQSDTHTLVMIDHCLDSDYRRIIQELCPELASNPKGLPLRSKRLPFLRNVITVGFSMPGALEFGEVMERSRLVSVRQVEAMSRMVRPDDVCNMQYTSGTTGFPKGVMLTHRNVVNNGKCIGDRMDLSTADRMMIQVPMFHCFGMVLSMTASMTHGATLCPLPYFSAASSLACVSQERITCFNGVPTMFIAMFNHPDFAKTDFSRMRTGIMAGSGCPPELMRRAADPNGMNMTGIVSVYGQTESSPGSTMSAWDDSLEVRTETVGYSFPHVECKVVDPQTGEEVKTGENGEFCSRGYNTMKGYYKMPEETALAIDKDGWLHSGDLAAKDKDGNYRITGRLKDMIIRGGENLYPKEIEEFIYTNPKVRDVQVVGVPDEKYGEEACACVILKDGESSSEQEMTDFIKASLARHKVPRYIRFVESFPMNAAGKILKYKMREDMIEELRLRK